MQVFCSVPTPTNIQMVEKFQCPGCVNGGDTQCGKFQWGSPSVQSCNGHVLGTSTLNVGSFALGLPKGFNRPGYREDATPRNQMDIRLWAEGQNPGWDRLNIAVWAMELDGYLFVRTYSPRINWSCVDVIEGGKLDMVIGALDVAGFIEEID